MKGKLQKWVNSLALRISKSLVREVKVASMLDLSAGSNPTIRPIARTRDQVVECQKTNRPRFLTGDDSLRFTTWYNEQKAKT
jgi:antitoxin component of MazEF toxin-antitoxin module